MCSDSERTTSSISSAGTLALSATLSIYSRGLALFAEGMAEPNVQPNPTPPPTAAEFQDAFDFDTDTDGDLDDFVVFQEVFTG